MFPFRQRSIGYQLCKVAYASAKPAVLGLVDDTHPSAAQLLDDPVMRNRLAIMA